MDSIQPPDRLVTNLVLGYNSTSDKQRKRWADYFRKVHRAATILSEKNDWYMPSIAMAMARCASKKSFLGLDRNQLHPLHLGAIQSNESASTAPDPASVAIETSPRVDRLSTVILHAASAPLPAYDKVILNVAFGEKVSKGCYDLMETSPLFNRCVTGAIITAAGELHIPHIELTAVLSGSYGRD